MDSTRLILVENIESTKVMIMNKNLYPSFEKFGRSKAIALLIVSIKNLLCRSDIGFAGHIKKQRRYPIWIIKVYNIRDGIAPIILYLFQNIEEKSCTEN